MSSQNLLVVILSMGVSSAALVITTTVNTETKITMDTPVNLVAEVEGNYTLDNCIDNCEVAYSGAISVSLEQAAENEPIIINTDFEMNSIEAISEIVSEV